MNTTLYLIRHAETVSNFDRIFAGSPNDGLSEKGENQSQKLADWFAANKKISAVYSSPYRRAVATAHYVATRFGLNVAEELDLQERDAGEWQGRTYDHLQLTYPDLFLKWQRAPGSIIIPGAETAEQCQERGKRIISDLATRHKGESICVVTHQGFLRVVLPHFAGESLHNFDGHKYDIDNTGISRLEARKGPIQLKSVNETPHLINL